MKMETPTTIQMILKKNAMINNILLFNKLFIIFILVVVKWSNHELNGRGRCISLTITCCNILLQGIVLLLSLL